MNERFFMNVKAGALIVFALAAGAYVFVYAQNVEKTYPTRTFSVDGEGHLDVVPDVARFNVSVVTEGGRNIVDVQQANAQKITAIHAFLAEQGIEKKDMRTTTYALTPRYDYPNCSGLAMCPPPSIAGYSLTQSFEVKVRDFAKIGNTLSGVVEKGANTVSDIAFTRDDEVTVKNDARVEAIEKAREKAKVIARAGNFRIGKLVSLYEEGAAVTSDSSGFGAQGGSMEQKATLAPVIEPGVQPTKVRVTLTYEIID